MDQTGSHRNSTGDDAGWTLVELMVVVLIIAILAAIAIATFVATTGSANAAACRANQRLLNDAAYLASYTPDTAPPDELEDLRPYLKNYDRAIKCPADGTTLLFNAATGKVTCPNHP